MGELPFAWGRVCAPLLPVLRVEGGSALSETLLCAHGGAGCS